MTTYTANFNAPKFEEGSADKFVSNAEALDLLDAALAAISQFAPDNVVNLDANGTLNGLTFGYLAGRVRDAATSVVTDVARGTLALTDDATNYVEVDDTGTVSANTTGFTAGDVPLYIVTTVGGHMTAIDDRRAWVVF